MLYPRDCSVTGVDLSDSMLERAHERVAKNGLRDVRLLQMDASALTFPDESFDIVYAPYLSGRARSRPGRARDAPGLPARRPRHHPEPLPQHRTRSCPGLERSISPLTVHIGFKSDLDLPAFLAQAELTPGLDRKGEHPADLVARHLYQRLSSRAALQCGRRTARLKSGPTADYDEHAFKGIPSLPRRCRCDCRARLWRRGLSPACVGSPACLGTAGAGGRHARRQPPRSADLADDVRGLLRGHQLCRRRRPLPRAGEESISFEFTEPLYAWRRVWRDGADGELTIRTRRSA